ncbi:MULTISPECIES: histidinol phosphate phosphatase domain-containing protein [Rossellomorea]|uniref:histidinol phosphate phosphatase domain-containing protein n=1 Tax=Rossellomorea TaxID=2837508 RepID=UPI001CCF4BC5|nr:MULTISPECIES: histidinol phosphate phosphatase domain-containing protein [Rossellomorea]MCA0149431.1 histidinol phosphate phosphatase domain-containing protein [Rossellomorea vietnamensis]WGG46760.1 histidinol phosphate phosphatase domain-containing protein [Rossellomorea sp. DA94]
MSVDYHVHLEEGPYSFRWLERTSRALQHFYPVTGEAHHRSWIQSSYKLLSERLEKGPYSSEWLDLYLQKAKERNLKEVGIVDHLYRFRETRDYFEKNMDISETDLGRKQHQWLKQVMTENMEDFVDFIESQKQKWAEHGIKLKLGMEADYFPGCHNQLKELLSTHRWDYVIGSVHFVDGWGFDNPEAIDQFEHYGLEELYGRFFQIVEEAIRSGLFDFVAHLDNLKVFNFRPHEEILLPHYEKIARALVDTNTATEVNAGLFYRYPIKEMCPSPSFLKVLAEAGVRFTTSSDSHFPDDIGLYVNENTERLKALGIHQIATF